MEKTNTTKELLNILVTQTADLNKKVSELSENYLNVTLKFSDYLNSQDKENTYFRGILEGNDKTHQKGIVEDVYDMKTDISGLKIDKKVTAGKISIAGLIFTAVGAIVLKALGVIKFFV